MKKKEEREERREVGEAGCRRVLLFLQAVLESTVTGMPE